MRKKNESNRRLKGHNPTSQFPAACHHFLFSYYGNVRLGIKTINFIICHICFVNVLSVPLYTHYSESCLFASFYNYFLLFPPPPPTKKKTTYPPYFLGMLPETNNSFWGLKHTKNKRRKYILFQHYLFNLIVHKQ